MKLLSISECFELPSSESLCFLCWRNWRRKWVRQLHSRILNRCCRRKTIKSKTCEDVFLSMSVYSVSFCFLLLRRKLWFCL